MARGLTVVPSYDMAEVDAYVRENVQRGLPSVPYGRYGGAVSVCGNGPSLRQMYPQHGPIAALNGAWRALAKNGITPDFIIMFDPCEQNASWFDDAPESPLYLIASCAHPSVYERLKGKKVYQWHTNGDAERAMGLGPLIGGGFSIGCLSLNLLHLLGFTHFNCYGYDSCYSIDGEHHATPQNWNITPPQPYQVGGRMFIAEPWMAAQVEYFLEQIEQNRWNYTVDVKGNGFLTAALEHNTLKVIYDLDVAPGSFDFMCSMINVENYRSIFGYSRVKVHFKPGRNKGFRPNDIIDIGHEQKNRMLNHVVRPLLEMFGMEETGTDPGEQGFVFQYSPKESLDHYRETGELPAFEAKPSARSWAAKNYGNRPYVITLREAYYWPQRNSDLSEWVKFAKTLLGRVVFVRDTEKHAEPIDGFETCPDASIDLHKRLALYRQAKMNFFVSNGPGGLAWYSRDIPYLTFYKNAPGYHCHDPQFLKEHIGLEPFGQFPWAGQHQRLVYADDTFENISAAFNDVEQQEAA